MMNSLARPQWRNKGTCSTRRQQRGKRVADAPDKTMEGYEPAKQKAA
jgi:hypothetical protein